ncbi:ABC transporter permease [Georgenia subflava]|uniref:Transport permease protein n=1 Tax=Georgenia subflava TaxID=1622177 RepID=A0A6N7EMX2_9MICO|nr:ABC transporter permease [Georgenia subflava]MPV38217.1 ABC transporter permease [Georgenia subflava]
MTTIAPSSRRGAAVPGRAWLTLTGTEARLFLREPGGVFFALIFPTLLLVGIGLVLPGMRDPMTDVPAAIAGLRPVDIYAPVALAVAIATPALTTLPVALATYREQGIFRRLGTTPMRPHAVLVSHVVINLGALVVAGLLALAAAAAVFGTPAPRQVAVAALAFLLGGAAMFGVGLIIASRVSKGANASGLGMLVYFPMLFLAGVWTPGPVMPDVVERVATYTPLGAASQALTEAWFGSGFPATELVVMAGWTLVTFPLAARLFRWS